MTTMAALLKRKPAALISVTPDTKIRDVVMVLAEKRIGAVVVQSSENDLLGILSERDVVRSLAANGTGTVDMVASQLMTRAPTTATPSTSIFEAETLMTEGRFRHLPIVDGGKLIGVVSIGDVVAGLMDEQAQEVRSLRDYVTGSAV
ncbi:CBS domain-containing protein [Acidiphilium sp. PA]|uniref:CBS domain-containing protein n=1 Tax=Acidiphilium sp. PA TaxID=2871705 RepID=UPI0022444025|nr:CBS domain-containing protein [Acidiphilium sp. PA]MCW8305914.1 CBS domain-containing protein [Acidiphilium sp. PA]